MILRIDPANLDLLPSMQDVQQAQAVIFNDADFLISAQQPMHLPQLVELVRTCITSTVPTLGIGFGARLIAYSEGGEIQHTPSKIENGATEIYKLHLADDDALFKDFPDVCTADSCRQDDIFSLPVTCVPLANSERTQFQAFKVAGKPIYGIQFDSAAQNIEKTFIQRIALSTAPVGPES